MFVPPLDQELLRVAIDLKSHLRTAMSGYLYELPTTKPVSFSSCYSDVAGSYIAQVVDTTEHRASLRTLLKDAKRNSEKDYLKLVKVWPGLIGAVYWESVDLTHAQSSPWMTIFRYWLG